jgi:hypothetical protein
MFYFKETFGPVALLLVLSGCGGAEPTTGGTQGVLHAGPASLSEIQVTIHQLQGNMFRPIGFGVPGADGGFCLVTNGATGPLVLLPGEYRCTLESVGAPVEIPAEYLKADTSPLKVTWSASDQKLDIDVPLPKPIR